MGDMADWNIENEQLTDWEGRGEDERPVKCKFCGEGGLYWMRVAQGKWRLATENGTVHSCPWQGAPERVVDRGRQR